MNSGEDYSEERLLNENGLAFSGAITASVTHELNNVYSIIDQTIGLLEDLLVSANPGRSIPNERLQRIADKIQAQTQRGVGIIKRLNTFAHSIDEPESDFEINQLVENLVELSRRFANLKKVELDVSYYSEPVTIRNNPFLLQQALFLCLTQALENALKGVRIRVAIDKVDNNVYLTLTRQPADPESDGYDVSYLKLLMNRIGGGVNLRAEGDNTIFELSIPLKKPT